MQAGLLDETELDTALGRIYTLAFQLGVPDGGWGTAAGDAHPNPHPNPNPYAALGTEVVDTPASRQLALEAALQGLVLLKNEATLPLQAERLQSLALIGPHANGSLICVWPGLDPHKLWLMLPDLSRMLWRMLPCLAVLRAPCGSP